MRILHLAKYYWPRTGGMERAVQSIAEGTAALGHQVEVVTVERLFSDTAGPKGRGNVTRAWSFGALGSQEIAPGYIALAWKKADVIHVHHPNPIADWGTLLRAGRTPVVVTHYADAKRGAYQRLARLVNRHRARAIVVPSRAHVALSEELLGFEGKVEVIPFGIDDQRWGVVPPPAPGAAPRALFIGRLEAYKGVDILLRALERVPDLKLDIVGKGPEAARLRTLAQALAVGDRVRWWGEHPDDDLPRRMADADFLVLPSVTVDEMFGLVLLEAMAAGRPVISTALPSAVREVNLADVTGFEVPIRDVSALARAMFTLSRDPELRQQMGEAGRRRVREQFSQRLMAQRYVELYDRIYSADRVLGHVD